MMDRHSRQFEEEHLDAFLAALGEHLRALSSEPVHLVVCGGSAMIALSIVKRATQDVDVVALLDVTLTGPGGLKPAEPVPDALRIARQRVAEDFSLPENWLDFRSTDLLRCGLPAGCEDRLTARYIDSHLTLHYLAREDLIPLKLYAFADLGEPRHEGDLRALAPSTSEWREAARWVMTHNEPDGFLHLLEAALRRLGAPDVADELDELL